MQPCSRLRSVITEFHMHLWCLYSLQTVAARAAAHCRRRAAEAPEHVAAERARVAFPDFNLNDLLDDPDEDDSGGIDPLLAPSREMDRIDDARAATNNKRKAGPPAPTPSGRAAKQAAHSASIASLIGGSQGDMMARFEAEAARSGAAVDSILNSINLLIA